MMGAGHVKVGPALREAVSIAFQHSWIFLLVGAVLSAAGVASLVLLTWCLFSSACLSTAAFEFFIGGEDLVHWTVNRLLAWPIQAIALCYILTLERSAPEEDGSDTSPRRRRAAYFWCVGYFVAISATSEFVGSVSALFRTASSGEQWLFIAGNGVVASAIWAYVDARFAVHLAAIICDGAAAGFMENWARAAGNRRRLLLLFFMIEALLYMGDIYAFGRTSLVINYYSFDRWVSGFITLPRDFLAARLPIFTEFVLYGTISNMFCAGAFVAVHRQMTAARRQDAAAVFD